MQAVKKSLPLALFMFATSTFATDFNGYIVKMKNQQNFTSNLKVLSQFGKIEKVSKTDFGTFVKVSTKNDLMNSQSLAKNPNIEYVEPNWIIKVEAPTSEAFEPTDDQFKKQWGLKNTGRNGGLFGGTAGEDINAQKAWTITRGSQDVKVAVIDTGIDYRHPDLKNQMDVNTAELNGQAGVDDDGNGYVDDVYGYDFVNKDGDPMDGNSHGTHCAGVIGASHDGKGIAGVMGQVKLIGIKFLSDKGSGETIDAISSIQYAVKRGVHVMSNSWGGGEYSEALKEAISHANDAGIVFVAASGNSSSNNDSRPTYPANYDLPNVITVGSFAATGSASSFSNYGVKTVHVFGPGSSIVSTVPNGRYSSMSGTSMACPHVSGVVGLMLAQKPTLTPSEVRDILISTSKKTSKLQGRSVSSGRVDAYEALLK